MTEAEKIAAGLTEAQRRMLVRVCNSNGGGLNAQTENQRVWAALYRKDLVQGKSGNLARIVHTPIGLAVRKVLEKADD